MNSASRFRDRTDAGQQLATALRDRDIDADIVLAIPRGGLPLGRAVADALDVALDIVVAKKIGARGNPEYAIGAVASDGSVWRNQEAFRVTGSDDAYFERQREREATAARKKAEQYRGTKAEPDLTGKSVVVVDDGVATGSTVRACLEKLQRDDPAHLVLAVPVGPPDTISELETLADDVVCLVSPSGFRAVGQYYQHFDQVSDDEARTYLDAT